MKRHIFFVTVFSILVLLSLVAYVPKAKAGLSSGTLADAMNTIITANSWVPTSSDAIGLSCYVAHYATVFSVGNPSYYQTAAQNDLAGSLPVQVLHCKRMAEIDGVPLAVSDATVQSYLSSAAMAGYVPITYQGQYFLIYDRFAAGAYRWAPPSLQSKWNAVGALAQINSIVQSGSPGTFIAYSQSGGFATYYRYYDDTAETLEWFLEVGGSSYMSTCDQIWAFQQSYFWNGQYYGYSGQSGMETEVGPFALISGRYLVTKGILSTYGSRVVSDLNQKLLISGYSSPLWNSYSLDHVPGRGERRLENAAAAWAAMHAYYPLMTSTMQATLQGMGSVGWRGLLDESGDFHASNNMFSYHADTAANMGSTGIGLMLLFMNGVVPKTGSLAVPLNDEYYEDAAGWSPATMFRFDYANRQIRIPVNAGTLNFIFGTGTASYTFPSTGVYQVQFSNDWNTVQSASRIGALDSGFKYIAATSPPPATGTLSLSATYNGNPVAAQVQVTGPTSTTVTTPTTITVTAGDYSLHGTYQAHSLDRTCTVPSNGQATVSFPFTSSPPATGTIRVFAVYASQNVAVQASVIGPSPSLAIQTGMTTTDPQNPLTFSSLNPGQYAVSGSYGAETVNQSVTVSAGNTADVTLDFGGTPPSPFPSYILPVVGVSAGSIIGVGIYAGWKRGVFKAESLAKPRRGKRRRRR